jgi:hypothetical protein
MSQTRTIGTTEDEILKSVDDQVAGADEARQDHLVGIESVLQARGKMLEREARRLAQKYPAGDPRVALASDRLMANNSVALFVRDELARGALTPPAPDKEAWIIFGLVRRPDGQPVAGVDVMLCDDRGASVAKVPPATTGKNGDYHLTVPVPKVPAGAVEDKVPVVHLEVFRGKRRLVADTEIFHPSPGAVVHRDIDLTTGT